MRDRESAQTKAVFRWLAKENLPAYVNSFHKVNLWARRSAGDRPALALINASLDDAHDVELLIRRGTDGLRVVDMDCAETAIRSDGLHGPYRRFRIPCIPAWRMILCVCQPE